MKRISIGGRNPVLPYDICVPDGEAHVFGGRLYVYGSFDTKSDGYCSGEYRAVYTDDMLTWTVGGKILESRNIDYTPCDTLYAPDCLFKDNKYYLYYCMADDSEGVAESDSPDGPFKKPVLMSAKGIDPAVFKDDDGSVYYYWGQFSANAVRLNDDLKTFDESAVIHGIVTEKEHGFHEGSSMRKRNGIYYFVYPCIYREGKPTALAYATSRSPLGPFRYRGIIVDNAKCDPKSWNIHGSIEKFDGQWYVFYHRSSGDSMFSRRLCAEKIEFNADGTINEVKMTSQGVGEPFSVGERIEAWRACGVDGGAYIKSDTLVMCDKSEAVFRYVRKNGKVSVKTEAEGGGSVETHFKEYKDGLYEMKLVCNGDLIVKSITLNAI
ncbi:MAG: family 43 glycosylhydrolase [Eubacterium sp.]|nr:family 43 glycosylhydrolase [Eubacterium sp.]